MQTIFQYPAGGKFSPFFQRWVYQAVLDISQSAQAEPWNRGYRLKAIIRQTQPGTPYQLTVPIAVHLEGETAAWQTQIKIDQPDNIIELDLPARPVRIDIDPQFDVFRRLDSREIPAALSQGFGAEKPLLILPANTGNAQLSQAYQLLASTWQKTQSGSLEIIRDDQLEALPADRTVWILGWQNKFGNQVVDALSEHGVIRKDGELLRDGQLFQQGKHAVVLTARQSSNSGSTLL
ncbi:MAG: signal protein PDZ, partial [Nitrosomonas sp.]|nr:signal protein PDZ [Nitrosomonas sp.]